VTADDVATVQRFAKLRKIDYPMLSDTDSEIIRAFGLLAENYPQGTFYYGVPHPAIIVIDTDGTVRHRFTESHYTLRPEIDDVLAVLRGTASG